MSGAPYIVRGDAGTHGFVVALEGTRGHVAGPYATEEYARSVAHRYNTEAGTPAPAALEDREREARTRLDEAVARALRAVSLMGERYDTELADLAARVASLEDVARGTVAAADALEPSSPRRPW